MAGPGAANRTQLQPEESPLPLTDGVVGPAYQGGGPLDEIVRKERPAISSPEWRPPTLWAQDVSQGEEDSAKDITTQVIPLPDLHKFLTDPKMLLKDVPEEFGMMVGFNIRFYSSWYPEQLHQQFDIAHKILGENGKKPSVFLMLLERTYSSNAERFTEWVCWWMNQWNDHNYGGISSYDRTLEYTLSLTKSWWGDLSAEQKEKISKVLKKTWEIVSSKDFSWNVGLMERDNIETNIRELAGIKELALPKEEIVKNALFMTDPKKCLDEFTGNYVFLHEKLDKKTARAVWDFFVKNYSKLFTFSSYWLQMEAFLNSNPDYIPQFLSRKALWFSRVPKDREFTGVVFVYSGLLEEGRIPAKDRRDVYLLLLSKFLPDISDYKHLSLQALEEKLIMDHLERKWKGSEPTPGEIHIWDPIGERLFRRYVERNGAEKAIALMKKACPALDEKNSPSARLTRLLVDKSPHAARSFLAELQDSKRPDTDLLKKDPFWQLVWTDFSGTLMVFSPWETIERAYSLVINTIPSVLIKNGQEDVLKEFYFERHPYTSVYQLPPDLRPTGKGTSFVSIDFFPDPVAVGHPDKSHVQSVNGTKWSDKDAFSHGLGVSTIAVGETMGLAPNAGLYADHIEIQNELNLPSAVLISLKKVIELKKKDPIVRVVGLSLGLGVPKQFRANVDDSKIYKELTDVCNELYNMGVAVVVSSGNDGIEGQINLLGFLPHVQLIGALDSQLTPDRSDDIKSTYAGSGDNANPVRFSAHADPVLFWGRPDEIVWLKKGGTSSAQPHFSGTLLCLMEINPGLSLDDYYRILELTSDPVAGDAETKGIDPMQAFVFAAHLPGSIYEGRAEELVRFSKLLGYDSAEVRNSKLLIKFKAEKRQDY